jgi:hypothetical protein
METRGRHVGKLHKFYQHQRRLRWVYWIRDIYYIVKCWALGHPPNKMDAAKAGYCWLCGRNVAKRTKTWIN